MTAWGKAWDSVCLQINAREPLELMRKFRNHIAVLVVQLCKLTENHWIYSHARWVSLYVNCTLIKQLNLETHQAYLKSEQDRILVSIMYALVMNLKTNIREWLLFHFLILPLSQITVVFTVPGVKRKYPNRWPGFPYFSIMCSCETSCFLQSLL